jgi:creatinine amidohydrolase
VDMYLAAEIDGCDIFGRLAYANYFETSCMLYVTPDLTKMDRATSKQDFGSFWDHRTDQVRAAGIWDRHIPEANAENGEHEVTRCIETMARAGAAGIKEPDPVRSRG